MNAEGATFRVRVKLGSAGRRRRGAGGDGESEATTPIGTIPRVARQLALAHQLQGMLDRGEVAHQKDLAAFAKVTRARVTQMMNLLLLAPDIQEEILFLPRTIHGRDPITERMVRTVCATPVWGEQRRRWASIRATKVGGSV